MSRRNSGYARQPRDRYETPAWCTEALLPFITHVESIWEPACASGKMLQVLARHRRFAVGTDIDCGVDFLAQTDTMGARWIVTNPPYNFAREFIEHALDLTRIVSGGVCMLLPSDYDFAKTRRHLFEDHPAWSRKIALRRRIKWFDEPGKGKSPSTNHMWALWDWTHSGPATLAYAA